MSRIIQRILVAEDDRGNALLLKRRLEKEGFSVMTAENGRVALGIIRSVLVDLVITDVVMPEMDGVELYLALKNNKATASVPIIIMTDKQMFKDAFWALGKDHFLPKPVDMNVLLAQIQQISSQDAEIRQYRKILVSGNNDTVVRQMQALLRVEGGLVTIVENPQEITFRALMMVPHIILLDLTIREDVSAREIIHSLRSYDRLKPIVILTFICVPPAGGQETQMSRAQLDERIESCQAAGATKYLGEFSPGSFLETLKEFMGRS